MAGAPRNINVRRTSHFLFETGSLMLSAFGLLFLIAALSTIVITSLTGSLPLLGGVAVVGFGALAYYYDNIDEMSTCRKRRKRESRDAQPAPDTYTETA